MIVGGFYLKKINRVIGIDLGNGLTNVRSTYEDGSPYLLTLPSVFALADKVGDAFGGAGAEYELDTIEVGGTKYVWGKDVYMLPIITTASKSETRYKTENYKKFVKIVLGMVAKDIELSPSEQVYISTGVPANQTGNDSVRYIKEAFLGDSEDFKGLHRVTVNGEEYTINVAEVSVTSQPLATVLSVYLNDKGRVKEKDLARMKVGIIDIGGGTLDLDTLINFNRQEDEKSEAIGFRDIYRAINLYLKKESKGKEIAVNDYVLLNIIQEAERKAEEEGTSPVYVYQHSAKTDPIDFTKAYIDALEQVGMKMNSTISDQWSDSDSFDRMFLVGGSAKRLAPYIEVLQNPDFPQDPGLSNVEGYYNFGMSEVAPKKAVK